MLTEDEARDLLTRAAATIDISPDTPDLIEPRRRPVWPILAAAAAVLVVVATAAALTLDGSPAPAPTPTPDSPVAVPTDGPDSPENREPDPAQRAADAAGAAWRAFARGGAAPRFADRVDLLWGNAHQRYLTADEATDRDAWDLCPRYMSAPCSISNLSPVHVINNEDDPIVRTPTSPTSTCFYRRGELPAYLAELGMVRLDQPEPRNCRDTWAVQVWVDQDGAIAAVNLLLGTAPASP